MEFSLNVVWLLLVLAGTHLCLRQQLALFSSRRELARALLATGILCVLLFPVVSATDDLHPVQAVVEEPGTQKAFSSIAHGSPFTGAAIHPVLTSFLLLVLFAPPMFLIGRVAEESTSLQFSVAPLTREGRAPPAFLH